MQLSRKASLKAYNSFGFDVSAEYLVIVKTLDELKGALGFCAENKLSLLVIGGGSNLILTQDISGLVVINRIVLKQVESTSDGDFLVTAGAGENWHEFVRWTLMQGYNGLENLSLIPGTVGAAPMQNIGAYGVEIKDRMEYLDALDRESGELCRFAAGECGFGYRDSVFKRIHAGRYIIISVTFRLSAKVGLVLDYSGLSAVVERQGIEDPTALQISDLICDIRRSKLPDPEALGNAGSFFKNPVIPEQQCAELTRRYPGLVSFSDQPGLRKLAAGWLIDQLGWKGHRQGAVGVYDKQALVLINYGKGSGGDILSLAQAIQASVADRYGVLLEIEPRTYP
ncbi:UDP-N-acetylmuramate dehydrogenase [Amphritea sp. HPY]|uniref:UDP-N-acetylmuramate dehydrogenase n=1 Tax=Amphritea sp. HPY TaxID=3421652 RepID=UPI003D7D895F